MSHYLPESVLKLAPEVGNVKDVLLLDSGGTRIGQAGEFDYSGGHAIKVRGSFKLLYLVHFEMPVLINFPFYVSLKHLAGAQGSCTHEALHCFGTYQHGQHS
jgi:hypothetical protein